MKQLEIEVMKAAIRERMGIEFVQRTLPGGTHFDSICVRCSQLIVSRFLPTNADGLAEGMEDMEAVWTHRESCP